MAALRNPLLALPTWGPHDGQSAGSASSSRHWLYQRRKQQPEAPAHRCNTHGFLKGRCTLVLFCNPHGVDGMASWNVIFLQEEVVQSCYPDQPAPFWGTGVFFCGAKCITPPPRFQTQIWEPLQKSDKMVLSLTHCTSTTLKT